MPTGMPGKTVSHLQVRPVLVTSDVVSLGGFATWFSLDVVCTETEPVDCNAHVLRIFGRM